jgi:excisionase family DNA binding protein
MTTLKHLTRRTVWLTTGAIADYCGVDRTTVVRWINTGWLKTLKTPGGQHRVRLEDFKAFLLSRGWEIPLDDHE